MIATQEVFEFPNQESLSWEDFIESDENHDALAYLKTWPHWNFPGLIMVGDHGVGKTHLASLWAQSSNAVCISKNNLGTDARDLFEHTEENKCGFVLEDFEELLSDEKWLFDFYNIAKEKRRSFLITDVNPLGLWSVTLPDLRSRLSLLPMVRIRNHSDELLFKVTRKLAKDYNMEISDSIIDYILIMCRRNIPEISNILKTLDKLSLQQKKSINLNFVKKYLNANYYEEMEQTS